MTKQVDAEGVAATIRRSIEVSTTHSRRVKLHSLGRLFGFKAWSPERKDRVHALLSDTGVAVAESLHDVAANDWLHLSLVGDEPKVVEHVPEQRPTPDLFEFLQTVRLDSEREVELHFASPLFHALGYNDEQEAAGYRFLLWQGVQQHSVEADLLYFSDGDHELATGNPLVLVECKDPSLPADSGVGQVKSYAYWVKPAYYVVTNGNGLAVYLYQGGAVPDIKRMETTRERLTDDFDALYQLLNPEDAMEARKQKLAMFASQQHAHPQAGAVDE